MRIIYGTLPPVGGRLTARLTALRGLPTFNMLALALQFAYQCPSFPCPYAALGTLPTGKSVFTSFLSRDECMSLQGAVGASLRAQPEWYNTFVRVLGFSKYGGPDGSGYAFWILNIAVFASVLLLGITCTAAGADMREEDLHDEHLERIRGNRWPQFFRAVRAFDSQFLRTPSPYR